MHNNRIIRLAVIGLLIVATMATLHFLGPSLLDILIEMHT